MRHSLLRLSVLALLLMVKMTVFGQGEFEVNGINYKITSNEDYTVAVVSRTPKYSGDIVIPESVNYNGKTFIVTSIARFAFSECSDMTSIDLPNTVTTIEYASFQYCNALTSIDIPNSVKTIEGNAFIRCGLTSVTIGNGISIINDDAFVNCVSIESLSLNCHSIGSWFKEKKKLKNLVLGDSVKSIGYRAFYGCVELSSVVIPNTPLYIRKCL